jgi:chaperonin cofactor prefoldin
MDEYQELREEFDIQDSEKEDYMTKIEEVSISLKECEIRL